MNNYESFTKLCLLSADSNTSNLSFNSIISNISNISNNSQENNNCRICSDRVNNIVYYCDCIGTTAPIHLECLKKWILERANNNQENYLKCEICHEKYKIKLKKTIDFTYNLKIKLFLIGIVNLIANFFFWYVLPHYSDILVDNSFYLFIFASICIIIESIKILNKNIIYKIDIYYYESDENTNLLRNNSNLNLLNA
jgi:hypothetical protein